MLRVSPLGYSIIRYGDFTEADTISPHYIFDKLELVIVLTSFKGSIKERGVNIIGRYCTHVMSEDLLVPLDM